MTRTPTVTVTLSGPVSAWLARQHDTGAATRADLVAYLMGEALGVDPELPEVRRVYAERVVREWRERGGK